MTTPVALRPRSAPPAATSASGGRGPQTPTPPRQQLNWWLKAVLDDFYAERQRWDDDLEAYSKGHPAEAAEFIEEFPRPQLRDFLIAHAYRYLVDAFEAAPPAPDLEAEAA